MPADRGLAAGRAKSSRAVEGAAVAASAGFNFTAQRAKPEPTAKARMLTADSVAAEIQSFGPDFIAFSR
jgi:hypothetical protein